MSEIAREWAERARKAQQAVNELGAGPPGTAPDYSAEVTAAIHGLTGVQKGLVLHYLAAADRRAFDAAVVLVTTRFPAAAQAAEARDG